MKNLKLFKTLLVLIGVLITGLTGQMWAGTKIYFKNTGSWDQVLCHYWGGSDGSGWPGTAMTQIGSTQYYVIDVGNNTSCLFQSAENTNKTSDQTVQADQVYVSGSGWKSGVSVDNYTIYFDCRNVTDWANPHLRIGRASYNSAYALSNVAGTKHLYSVSTPAWEDYTAYTIANSAGWANAHNIYQPSDEKPTGDYAITKLINYQSGNILENKYITPSTWNKNEKDADYWNVTVTNSLPSYTVTFTSSPGHGTIAVKKYTKTDGSAKSTISTGAAVLPTQIIEITATPADNYALATLNVTNATCISGTTYYVTGNCTITATFDHQWAIQGSMSNDDWATFYSLPYSSTNTYVGTIANLSANTTYYFKVTDRRSGTQYGYGNSDSYRRTFVGQTSALGTASDERELMLKTADAGTYTFTWNSSSKELIVGYPTVTHPSGNYVYFKNNPGWDYITAHIFNGTPASTGWDQLPVLSTFDFDGTNYYYAATGGNDNILASEGTTDDEAKKTADLTVSKGKGKYYDIVTKSASGSEDDAKWKTFDATLKLDHQGATNTPAPNSITVTYNASTNLTGDVITTTPQKTGYTFGGYYTEIGGAGDQLIGTNENVIASVAGHTGTSKIWIKGPAICSDTCYAKWTQSVPLDPENGDDSESVTLTYNSASHAAITNPTRTNYTFAGWYTGDDGSGNLVINTSGVLQANVTDGVAFTGAGGIWTHTGSAPTLHAKWDEIPYTVEVGVDAGGGGTTNVSSVTDAKVVTGSSTITATPSNAAWRFKEWQLGTGVSINTGSTTSASITVNATQNSSITAVFEPRFALEGSLMDDNAGGMPGWEHVNAADFEVISFTGLGASGVDLRCSRTLEPNKEYKFRIYDRERANRLGVASSDYLLDANSSVELSTVGDESGKNVLINTVGYGTYIFHITQLSATNYYPTIEVIRQTSYQSNFDTYYQDAEGTLSQGTTGGTISVSSSQGGNTYDLTRSGQWVCSGGSITYTATPATGYSFAGWYHSTAYNDWFSNTNPWTDASITTTSAAYAKFVENTDTLKTTGNWSTAGNWSKGSVPTINDVVIINQPVNVDVTTAKAKRIKFGESGSLTIAATGVLEVAGTITNTDASKIVINTTSSSQGALIYDISTAPYATVNMTIPNTDKFHYIASPVGYVPVDPTFAGKDVYTYAWIEGKGWDKRGFYEGFSGDEVILIKGLSGCTFSGQLRPTTGGSISCTATPANANAQGVNMVPNTLTAPIKIAAMDLSAAYEGAVHIWNGSTWNSYAQSSCGDAAVIPALQGYAVLTEDGGTVSFTYDAAVRGASSHNDALRAPQRTNSDIQDHITLSVTTNERKENLLLYENNQFSDAIDKGWEALYMEGDGTYGELYAHAKEPMSILATDSLEGTVLGFVPGQAETYTISFEGDGRGYYLNDVKEEEATLIEEGNTYEFAADAATNATRFVISKTPIKKTPTGVDNTNDGVKARKQLIDGTLYIIRDGRLYNTTGALVK